MIENVYQQSVPNTLRQKKNLDVSDDCIMCRALPFSIIDMRKQKTI